MGFREFYTNLPLAGQVPRQQLYIPGYTEALALFSGTRVILSEEWISGVPVDLQSYFFRVHFPCYFLPIFKGSDCFGFVVKGFSKETPRFCTNMLLPGCERINGGEVVVFVEGLKDSYLPIKALKDLHAVVVPMLTAVPSRELLGFLKGMNCSVLYVPDNDNYRQDHAARFFELCGKAKIFCSVFDLAGFKDFGDFFQECYRDAALLEGKRLRETVKGLISF